jgi:hypothetical protein
MAKLIKGDSIQNIITDGDIVITSPYKNGKTLNEVLVEQQSDIDKLKSNVKYIYAYGGVGNNGGSGGSGGTGDIDLGGYATKNFVYNEIDKIKIIIPDITTKQDIIEDLETIRTGAELGATAIQESDLNEALNNKQDVLSPGDCIQINNNEISINSSELIENYPVLNPDNIIIGTNNKSLTIYPYRSENGTNVGNNTAEADFSTAIGFDCKAYSGAKNSFVGGDKCIVNNEDCFVYGEGLITSYSNSTMFGKYNIISNYNSWGNKKPIFFIGGGSSDTSRSTLLAQQGNKGDLCCAGGFANNAGFDFAEYFEWYDGNVENEDRIGYMVQIKDDKIELSQSFDTCIGITTGTYGFVCDTQQLEWVGKYLKDEYGRYLYDKEGNPILNEKYNDSLEYIPREFRKEWSPVGLIGKILTRQDGTLSVGDLAGCKDGIATKSDVGYRVLKIVNENVALLLVK